MIRVKNKKVIRRLSQRGLHANKLRNIVAIIAIALTTIMFTSLFTIGGSFIKTTEVNTCKQVGSMSHAGYKQMTEEEYNKVKQNKRIKDISYNIYVGSGKSEELSKVRTEVRYCEDKCAKWWFAYPEKGTMPKEYQDLAASTDVLDALGVSHELGQKVKLSFDVNGEIHEDTFTLSGFWKSDSSIMPAQEIWLSKEYVNKVCPTPTIDLVEQDDQSQMAGYLASDIMFSNSWNIEKNLERVTKECGYDEARLNGGVNWAYSASTVDQETIILIVLVLLVIFISGYLLIYNIFYISVTKDTRYYGLLKTIGTTGRQLKQMVRRQALLLAVPGVLVGLFIGWVVGVWLFPIIADNTYYKGQSVTSANPLIFIGSALFSLITVYISCNKPARLSAKVSPIDALRSQEVTIKKKKKKVKKVNTYALAKQNVSRNKKKVVVVVLSLSLSLILLNTTYGIVKSFDMDLYIKESIISDFEVTNERLQNQFKLTYLDSDMQKQVESIDGVNQTGLIYMTENEHQLSEVAKKNMIRIFNQKDRDPRKYYPDMIDTIEQSMKDGVISAHLYGMNQYSVDKLEVCDGEIDWEKFKTGGYVIASPFLISEKGKGEGYYKPGDKITLDYQGGNKKEYTVMAIAEIPYVMTCQHSHIIDEAYMIPDSEYRANVNEESLIHILLDVADEKESTINETITNIRDTSDVDFISKESVVKEFEDYLHMYQVVGLSLSVILGVIGILNFINSMATAILARKQELAMLQSVGMTTKQMIKMLILEGLLYACYTIVAVLTIGNVLSYYIIHLVAGTVWFFTYHFSILPIIICIPALLAVLVCVPVCCFKNVQKQSVIERLREAE